MVIQVLKKQPLNKGTGNSCPCPCHEDIRGGGRRGIVLILNLSIIWRWLPTSSGSSNKLKWIQLAHGKVRLYYINITHEASTKHVKVFKYLMIVVHHISTTFHCQTNKTCSDYQEVITRWRNMPFYYDFQWNGVLSTWLETVMVSDS